MHSRSIVNPVFMDGVGLHGGKSVSMEIWPGAPGDGIRVGRSHAAASPIGSLATTPTDRCTRLVLPDGSSVDTVEHLLAALRIQRISDCVLVLPDAEVPILDGSARPWLEALGGAGLAGSPAGDIPVVRSFTFEYGASRYEVSPGPFELDVTIDYDHAAIGLQRVRCTEQDLGTLADSRTFALAQEIEALRRAGLALGGSLANAVVIGEDGPVNPEGFRRPDECVRHKALDLLGDLFVHGAAIGGKIKAYRPGHSGNGRLLRAMIENGVLGTSHAVELEAA